MPFEDLLPFLEEEIKDADEGSSPVVPLPGFS